MGTWEASAERYNLIGYFHTLSRDCAQYDVCVVSDLPIVLLRVICVYCHGLLRCEGGEARSCTRSL